MATQQPVATTELFIYWRCAAGDAEAAEAAVAAVQQQLRAQLPGLATLRYRRSDDAAAELTWMETYGRADTGLNPDELVAIETVTAAALARWCRGRRHPERFERRS